MGTIWKEYKKKYTDVILPPKQTQTASTRHTSALWWLVTHRLHPHRRRWPSSTCRTAQCPARLCWWRSTRGRGWCRSCPCCPRTGVSSVSGCEGLPGRCRLTGPRWRRSCERGRIRHRHPEPTGRTLGRWRQEVDKIRSEIVSKKNLFFNCTVLSFSNASLKTEQTSYSTTLSEKVFF